MFKTRYNNCIALTLDTKSNHINLDGGYNEDSYTWTLKDNNEENLNYILIVESLIKEKDNITLYTREFINFTNKNYIKENNKVVGVKYGDINFMFDGEHKVIRGSKIYRLVKIDEEFLSKNIYEVTYHDYKQGNYEVLE